MVLIERNYYAPTKRSPSSYRDQVYSLTGLPTLPEIATEVMKLTREDRLSASQMVPIIDKDPSLTMKLLKIANSAYYGIQEKVDSLRQAIVVIGMKELGNLAIGFSVIKAFMGGDDQDQVDWRRFWEHCAACGHIAEIFNGELRLRITSSPYSLGLLHDVGKLVLYRINPDLYGETLKFAQKEKCNSVEAELEMFGITHMDAGRWIAEKWKLPDAIMYAVGFHHNPQDVTDQEYLESTALIQIVDLVTNIKGLYFEKYAYTTFPEEIEGWKILQANYGHLAEAGLKEFVLNMTDYFEGVKNMVSIIHV